MLEQIIDELTIEVDDGTKVKVELEKDFRKLQQTIDESRKKFNQLVDALDLRNKNSVAVTKEQNDILKKTEKELAEAEDDFDKTQTRFRERRNAVFANTEENEKLIQEFTEKTQALEEEYANYEQEEEDMKPAYQELQKLHLEEELKYNKLKNQVLSLNQKLKSCNQQIVKDDQIILDMQLPRENFKGKLSEERDNLDDCIETYRKSIYRIERQIYEIERKFEEYGNRNEEILGRCEKLLENTEYNKELKGKLVEKNLEQNLAHSENLVEVKVLRVVGILRLLCQQAHGHLVKNG